MRKRYREVAACPVDDAFFGALEAAANVKFTADQRALIEKYLNDLDTMEASRQAYLRSTAMRLERGKLTKAAENGSVYGLLMVFESAVGKISANRPRSNPNIAAGPAADYLRQIWLGLDRPWISQDGFARLALRVWLEPRAKVRKARADYERRMVAAWMRLD